MLISLSFLVEFKAQITNLPKNLSNLKKIGQLKELEEKWGFKTRQI